MNGFRQTTIAVVLCAAGLAIPAQAAFQMILAEPTSETVTGNQPAVSRPATPMQPPILPDTAECTATTRAGDTLSSFAKRETGQTEAWREIARMNRLDNPNRIGIGWTLAFPCPADGATDAMVAAIQKVGEALANDTKEDNPDSAGATEISVEGSAAAPWSDEMPPSDAARANTSVPARLRDAPVTPPASESPDDGVTLRPEQKQTQSVTALAAAPDSAPAPATTQPVVPPAASQEASACSATVARGDTLSSIANTWLGSAKRWHEIADLNQITNPDRIPIGKELTLPCGGTVTATPPAIVPTEEPESQTAPLPIWRAAAGEHLDNIITRWAWTAGWEPIQKERWYWRFDTDFEYQGAFVEAIDHVLRGFPSSGQAPVVILHENQVLSLEYR